MFVLCWKWILHAINLAKSLELLCFKFIADIYKQQQDKQADKFRLFELFEQNREASQVNNSLLLYHITHIQVWAVVVPGKVDMQT